MYSIGVYNVYQRSVSIQCFHVCGSLPTDHYQRVFPTNSFLHFSSPIYPLILLPSFPSALELRVSFGLLNNLPLFSSPSEAECLISGQFSLYGVRILASRPTPNQEDQGIPLRLAPTPWPVRHGWVYQQLRSRRHSSQGLRSTQTPPPR
jgi:hypothetical protein